MGGAPDRVTRQNSCWNPRRTRAHFPSSPRRIYAETPRSFAPRVPSFHVAGSGCRRREPRDTLHAQLHPLRAQDRPRNPPRLRPLRSAFRAVVGPAPRPGVHRRQPRHRPAQRRRDLPAHAGRHRRGALFDHAGKLHLLEGPHRGGFLPAALRPGARGREGPRLARRRGVRLHRQPAGQGDAPGGLSGGDLQHHRIQRFGPPQQPHAPQAARRGRQGGLHRRGGHRGRVERPRAVAPALARFPLSGGGSGRRADAERLHRQLDGDGGHRAPRRRLFSRVAPGRRPRLPGVQKARRTRAAIPRG